MALAKLSLVPKPAHEASPRPFRTFYYGPRSLPSDWSHRGAAVTLRGAVLAAARQILDKRAVKALIHGEDGQVVSTVERRAGKLVIIGFWEGEL